MTQADKLQALLQKAIEGGWPWELNPKQKPKDIWIMLLPRPLKRGSRGYILRHEIDAPLVIFNHDFAKALWGEKFLEEMEEPWVIRAQQDLWSGGPEYFEFGGTIWQYHLQQAVIADDPIGYMYRAVFGE